MNPLIPGAGALADGGRGGVDDSFTHRCARNLLSGNAEQSTLGGWRYGEIIARHRWFFYLAEPASGTLRKPHVALVYCVCGAEPVTVGVYELVPDDVDTEEDRFGLIGCPDVLANSLFHSLMQIKYLGSIANPYLVKELPKTSANTLRVYTSQLKGYTSRLSANCHLASINKIALCCAAPCSCPEAEGRMRL